MELGDDFKCFRDALNLVLQIWRRNDDVSKLYVLRRLRAKASKACCCLQVSSAFCRSGTLLLSYRFWASVSWISVECGWDKTCATKGRYPGPQALDCSKQGDWLAAAWTLDSTLQGSLVCAPIGVLVMRSLSWKIIRDWNAPLLTFLRWYKNKPHPARISLINNIRKRSLGWEWYSHGCR